MGETFTQHDGPSTVVGWEAQGEEAEVREVKTTSVIHLTKKLLEVVLRFH